MIAVVKKGLRNLIIITVIKLSIQHYNPPPSECLLAETCNHTWVPECAQERVRFDKRIFSDNCNRHEYNCDYKKDYSKVDITECSENASTTKNPVPKITNATTMTSKTDVIPPFTPTTLTENTTFDPPQIIPANANCSRNVTLDVCSTLTEPLTTTTMVTEHITQSENNTIEKFDETTENVTTTDNQDNTTNIYENENVTTTENQESTTNIDENNLHKKNVTENENSTVKTTSETCLTNATYPDACKRPITWETTAKGETRDFFQILREKFGNNNVKILRATTHWPRRTSVLKSNTESFVFGKHSESRKKKNNVVLYDE